MGTPTASSMRSPGLGTLALVLLSGTSLIGLLALLTQRNEPWALARLGEPYLLQILLFTVGQALLSTLISVVLAIPVALALHLRGTFPGRALLLKLSLLAFVMPSLVLITALIILFGRQGWLTPSITLITGESWSLYGLPGILLGHVFLNLPFAVRCLVQRLHELPTPALRLALQMRLSPSQRWRVLLWPHCRSTLLLVGGFIFILCFNSFAVVLALGGGPRATTLEVAIYQAIRFDFDVNEALWLCSIQLLIAGGLMLLVNRWGQVQWLLTPRQQMPLLPHPTRCQARIWNTLILLYAVALVLPLAALVSRALAGGLDPSDLRAILEAALWSLLLAVIAAVLATALAWAALLPARHARLRRQGRTPAALEWLAMQTLPVPAMVLSVGLYVLVIRAGWLDEARLPLLIWLNALLVVPFAVSQLKPLLYHHDSQYERLGRNWRLSARQRRRIEWRLLRTALPLPLALTGLLALGDVAVFSLFGDPEHPTLPWLIYRYAGTYRMHEAAMAGTLLLLCSLLLIRLMEGRRHA